MDSMLEFIKAVLPSSEDGATLDKLGNFVSNFCSSSSSLMRSASCPKWMPHIFFTVLLS